MSSNSTIEDQWSDAEEQDPSNSYALSGKIMLTSMITLFVVVVLLVILHLYARWYLVRINRRRDVRHRRNRPTRVVFYVDNHRESPPPTGGLDASVLKSLPLFVYSSEKGGNTPECAVCLSEFEEGETGRVLPNCKHGFHIGCIDMWFYSHSTCPLCRSPVEPVEPEMPVSYECGTEPGSSASLSSLEAVDRRKRVDVRIDVPERNDSVAETEFRQTSPSQGFRSPASRLLSLKRIMAMSRKSPVVSPSSGVGPSCDSVVTDSGESTRQEVGHESSRC